MASRAAALWREFLTDFPQFDPSSDCYDEGVDGANVVDWIGAHEDEIKDAIIEEEKLSSTTPTPKSGGLQFQGRERVEQERGLR